MRLFRASYFGEAETTTSDEDPANPDCPINGLRLGWVARRPR
jgi:hypothetical protein